MPKICGSPTQRLFHPILSYCSFISKEGDHQFLLHNINSSATPWNTKTDGADDVMEKNKKHCMIFLIKIFWKPSHFGQMSCLNWRSGTLSNLFYPSITIKWIEDRKNWSLNAGIKLSISSSGAVGAHQGFTCLEQSWCSCPQLSSQPWVHWL